MKQKKLNRAQQKKRQLKLQLLAKQRKAEKERQRLLKQGVHGKAREVNNEEFRVLSKNNILKKKPQEDRNSQVNIVDKSVNYKQTELVQKREDDYSGEMLERELKAQQETERKKKRVAVTFNKGAYQYITDETDPTDIGR